MVVVLWAKPFPKTKVIISFIDQPTGLQNVSCYVSKLPRGRAVEQHLIRFMYLVVTQQKSTWLYGYPSMDKAVDNGWLDGWNRWAHTVNIRWITFRILFIHFMHLLRILVCFIHFVGYIPVTQFVYLVNSLHIVSTKLWVCYMLCKIYVSRFMCCAVRLSSPAYKLRLTEAGW